MFAFLGGVLGGVAGLPAVGDDVELAVVVEGFGDELPGDGVEFDAVGAQFGGA